ncbi:unnamed protein product, partial [marine sediment metagenome]
PLKYLTPTEWQDLVPRPFSNTYSFQKKYLGDLIKKTIEKMKRRNLPPLILTPEAPEEFIVRVKASGSGSGSPIGT